MSPHIEKSLTTDQHDIVDRLLALGRSLKTARLSSWAEAHSPQDPRYDQGLELIAQVDNFLQARINRHGRGSASPSSTSSTEELASSHDASDEDTSMSHRLAALSSLSQALNTADPAAFLGIAVFAFFEVISDRAFGEWDCHLRGARSLLDYHCRSSDELNVLSRRFTGLDEIVAYFGWWDTTSTIVRKSTSSSNIGTQEGLIFDDWHRSVLGDDFFNRVGCPPETFWLFVSLAKGNGPADSRERLTQAMSQLLKLGMDNTERGKCVDVYRCAAAIAILTWPKLDVESDIPTSSTSSDITLTAAVDRICHIIESACPRSRFLAHMATPAYLAGTVKWEKFLAIRVRICSAKRDGKKEG
ncbi:hypothetical protein FSARC_10879 [Fusarium sarcochroum]|uniref:Uncharacterized protein n=1 Tax=Fusarium sarcochroum TaxID=1208366 RepID=A0A8H4TJF1_9HYPO|nr:hypothetical protein FSARC_10879 [Fusarium sarcochroum]